MATCFATLSMLALVRLSLAKADATYGFAWWSVWAGLFAGAAAATKAPCGLVLAWIVPAVLIRSRSLAALMLGSLVSGLAAFLVFRIAHPYAFEGPGFWDLALSERWLGNLQEQLRLGRPSLGYPPAVQWVDRSPLFSISNMFHWGIGELPSILIALALTVGVYVAVRARQWRYLLLVSWGVAAFVYLALIAPNRYLRYQLPAYPVFFAVAGCFASWLGSQRARWVRQLATLGVATTVLYSALWSAAFSRIYIQETPRVAATRWIFRNIPAALSLETISNNNLRLYPLSIAAPVTLGPQTTVRMTIVSGSEVYATALTVAFLDQPLLAQATLSVSVPGLVPERMAAPGSARIEFPELVRFEAGRQYPLLLTVHNIEAPLIIRRPRIAHETPWDDTLPIRMDRFDPFGGIYDGDLTLELFFRDSAEKIEKIVSGLERADYFFITSQRVWGSVGRLSRFYPMTHQFYRDLLGCAEPDDLLECFSRVGANSSGGTLGFELIKTFESYPRLGAWSIPDERADESFSVYDHPRVLLFKKTQKFSASALRERLRALLPDPRKLPPDP
ncbi:MAG: hypothetical protein EBZ48_00105 [Proteobacteria bacterium]|nr:hypothetical protein [Pseudomonadota bacterium]